MSLLSLEQVRQAELMDDPALPEADHLHALDALATINAVSRTAIQIAAAAASLIPRDDAGPIHVVDLACGGGDVTLACGRRLVLALGGREVVMTGVDMSRRGLDRAAARVTAAREQLAGLPLRCAFMAPRRAMSRSVRSSSTISTTGRQSACSSRWRLHAGGDSWSPT